MGYIKLEEHNDWGALYLSLPGRGLSGTFQTADRKNGISFVDGQSIHVAWPDGTQSQETIVHRELSVVVSDHGHQNVVRSDRPGIETVVRGVTHWTPLAHLLVLEEDIVLER